MPPSTTMPPLPQPLMDELVEECLLRLPPDDPASLVRAALVCKDWRRILADRGFCRRFRKLHRRPPMLGFLHCRTEPPLKPCFTPTSSFRPRCNAADLRGRRAIDSHHGRVLVARASRLSHSLAVWDPFTGKLVELPALPPPQHPGRFGFHWRAAVLCASTACDHVGCHRGHFLVVFMDTSQDEVCVYVYSSQDGAWSQPTSTAQDIHAPVYFFHLETCALALNALYFRVYSSMSNGGILKYDLGAQEISWFDLPPDCSSLRCPILLTTTELGGLGIARVERSRSKLRLWSREVGADRVFGWAPSGVIELKTVLSVNPHKIYRVAFVHGLSAFFVRAKSGVFTIDLVSNQVKKVCENNYIGYFVPYASFCVPAFTEGS